MSASFTNQVLAQIELWQNHKKYQNRSTCCPSTSTRRSRALHLDKLGVKLTKLTHRSRPSISASPPAGPFKPEHYRY